MAIFNGPADVLQWLRKYGGLPKEILEKGEFAAQNHPKFRFALWVLLMVPRSLSFQTPYGASASAQPVPIKRIPPTTVDIRLLR